MAVLCVPLEPQSLKTAFFSDRPLLLKRPAFVRACVVVRRQHPNWPHGAGRRTQFLVPSRSLPMAPLTAAGTSKTWRHVLALENVTFDVCSCSISELLPLRWHRLGACF